MFKQPSGDMAKIRLRAYWHKKRKLLWREQLEIGKSSCRIRGVSDAVNQYCYGRKHPGLDDLGAMDGGFLMEMLF